MATKKKAATATAASLRGLSGASKKALQPLVDEGQPVQVIGRVVNGKLEIDSASIADFNRKFPNAKMTFVAVNAPFDPVQTCSRV